MKVETNQLCFYCANFAGGCEWSRSFDPVPGWVAKPATQRKTRYTTESQLVNPNLKKPGWHVIACPKFRRDVYDDLGKDNP